MHVLMHTHAHSHPQAHTQCRVCVCAWWDTYLNFWAVWHLQDVVFVFGIVLKSSRDEAGEENLHGSRHRRPAVRGHQ